MHSRKVSDVTKLKEAKENLVYKVNAYNKMGINPSKIKQELYHIRALILLLGQD